MWRETAPLPVDVKAAEGERTSLSVIVISWCRPRHLEICLKHLEQTLPQPDEVIVVDASPDNASHLIADRFDFAHYIHFPGGAGHMTRSRNVGLLASRGNLIAFVDDDAFVGAGWSAAVCGAFVDSTVGAVAGRTLNNQPNEHTEGVDWIGRLLPNGEITGNFAADPGRAIEVDHGIGANMTFTRRVLAQLGGFRTDFGGIGGVREDTDMFLRVRALGYRVMFVPDAVAQHVGAPHVRGKRFDYRYTFFARRNHALLLARSFGWGSPIFRRWFGTELERILTESAPNLPRRVVRAALGVGALGTGLAVSLVRGRFGPSSPIRTDSTGSAISEYLGS